MADLAKLLVRIEADNSKLRSELVKSTKQLKRFETTSRKVVSSISRNFKLLAGGAGIAAIGKGFSSAISQISSFEQSLSNVKSVTGASADEMKLLANSARDLGASTVFSAQEAASGMEFLGRAGFETSEIIAAMPGLLDLAASGALDLGSAADIASNVLSGFGLNAEESNRVADVLAGTAAKSNTSVEQLGEAMAYTAPVAANLGISLEETAAAIGVLGNAGIQSTKAGTGLSGILSRLVRLTPKASAALDDLNVSASDVNPTTNTLAEILSTLSDAGLDAASAVDIFGQENLKSILSLTSALDEYGSLETALKTISGFAEKAAGIRLDNLAGDTKQLGSAFAELILQLGEETGVTGALRTATQAATDFIRSLDKGLEGDTLGELQAKLNSLSSGTVGGRTGKANKANFARQLREQIETELASLPGAEGVRGKLSSVEDALNNSESRIAELRSNISAIPLSERQESKGRGRSKRKTEYSVLNDELEKQLSTQKELTTQRADLFAKLAQEEFTAKALTLETELTENAAVSYGEALDSNNEKLETAVKLVAKQKQTFEELVKSTKESINAPEANPLTEGTPIEALRAIDEAASLSSAGDKEGSIKAASRALELTKALSESGTISDQYANQLVDRAAELGGESFGQQPIQVGIDQEFMRANAITAYNIVQEKFYDPLKLAFAADNPTAAATPQLPQGATKPDGSPVYIQVGDKEYEIEGKGPGMDKIRAEFARQNAKWAAK